MPSEKEKGRIDARPEEQSIRPFESVWGTLIGNAIRDAPRVPDCADAGFPALVVVKGILTKAGFVRNLDIFRLSRPASPQRDLKFGWSGKMPACAGMTVGRFGRSCIFPLAHLCRHPSAGWGLFGTVHEKPAFAGMAGAQNLFSWRSGFRLHL